MIEINNNNYSKDLNLNNKEGDLIHNIEKAFNHIDHKSDKNKFLETIYERLNNKNTYNINEIIIDYCQKFLNYSYEEIENLMFKYF